MGNIEQGELINYTAAADVGLSLIENISLSYYYALPNKLFEYIMAEVPVVVSNLPQMAEVVKEYKIGDVVELEEKGSLVNCLKNLLTDNKKLFAYKQNCFEASKRLNWEKEFEEIKHIFN